MKVIFANEDTITVRMTADESADFNLEAEGLQFDDLNHFERQALSEDEDAYHEIPRYVNEQPNATFYKFVSVYHRDIWDAGFDIPDITETTRRYRLAFH